MGAHCAPRIIVYGSPTAVTIQPVSIRLLASMK